MGSPCLITWSRIISGVVHCLPWAFVLCVAAFVSYTLYFNVQKNIAVLVLALLVIVYFTWRIILKTAGGRLHSTSSAASEVINRLWILRNARGLLSAAALLGVGVFAMVDGRDTPMRYVAIAGIVFFMIFGFIVSTNPAKVPWITVSAGIATQLVLGLIILRWRAGYDALAWLANNITTFVNYGKVGAKFVFGEKSNLHSYAMEVMPILVYFGAVTSALYYLGAMQAAVSAVGKVVSWILGTGMAESFVAVANILFGPETSVMMIRPMVPQLTSSEYHSLMTSGMATIGGGLMAVYSSFGVPSVHLLSASFMSAPAALVVAKLLHPENQQRPKSKSDKLVFTDRKDENLISAVCSGASSSLPAVAGILVSQISVQSTLAFVNSTIGWFGARAGVTGLTFQKLLSYPLTPVTFLLGIEWKDCRLVAELIGIKTILNEFIAYTELSKLIKNREQGLLPAISVRSEAIATYALCGYSNIGTVGAVLGFLIAMAPNRTGEITSVAFRALLTSNMACLLTACVSGLLYQG